MATKPDYNKNVTSGHPWAPQPVLGKTVNNRGSTEHNIITHQSNRHAGILPTSVLDRKSNNRMKGITEIRDLLRLTAVNVNHDHGKAFAENPNVFKKNDGANTHLYNAAARFGQSKPFDK
jgi:hypothetical protein